MKQSKIPYFIILLCFKYCCCASFNGSILPHQYLKDGDVLVSNGRKFELGFFSPGNSNRRYLGIWFGNADENTIVWVANRDTPINDKSGILSINGHGSLVIHSKNQNSAQWSSNLTISAPTNVSMVTLLDSGNLVLFHSDKKTVLWQSFDFPTHTLLPSMKLGLDRRTGFNWFLTSWKSQDDPGTGNLAYRIDPSGFPQLFLFKGEVPVWRTGPWNGMRWSGVPQMSNKASLYKDTLFVNNGDEIYMSINTIDTSVWSRLVVDVSGSVDLFTWSEADPKWNKLFSAPVDQCDDYGLCGGYSSCNPYNPNEFICRCLPGYEPKSARNWGMRDGSEGCVRKLVTSPECGKGEGFVKMGRVKIPDTRRAHINMTMSLKDCKEGCLSNCSCKAYANADIRDGRNGCVTWYEDLMDTREYMYINGGQDLYIRVDADELGNYDDKKNCPNKKMIMAVLATSIALFSVFVIFFVYCHVKKKRKGKEDEPCSSDFQDSQMSKELLQNQTHSDLPFFDLDTISEATDNFSFANKLGEGGFGPVYKGILPNGQEIAVKRLSKSSGQGTQEFKNEVMLIAKLQHRNLVRLFGCCTQKDEKMLVYEYLPNNSLDSIIFDETNKSLLDWRKRFEIICGIARGILYLHEDSRLRIIHRDLKASNVLLDATLNPKISDFGMARIFGVDQIEANTNRVVGTYGYMSPEYAMEGLFSVKSDVYSFGVLLLEIVAGRKNSSFLLQQSSSNLIGHIWNLWKEGRGLEIVDASTLGESYCVDGVLRCIQIGLLCVQECASDRPTMFTVVFMLGNDGPISTPKQPAFILKRSFSSAEPSTASEGSNSATANALTVTMREGR